MGPCCVRTGLRARPLYGNDGGATQSAKAQGPHLFFTVLPRRYYSVEGLVLPFGRGGTTLLLNLLYFRLLSENLL